MERQYTAFADTGRDYITFEFYSNHRANSKANLEDAKRFYKKKHGSNVEIRKTTYNREEIL